MKILSIEMENFRQYLGVQQIEFASTEQNITIVFGENGKGKTGIFRALMFALYNSKHIQQDDKNEKIHLVNLLLLDKSNNAPCKARVTVKFEHRNKRYELTRTVVALKLAKKVQERDGEVKLVEIDELGNYSPTAITNPLEVKKVMNAILDEDIKDFFLFDGEKIDTLAKTNEAVKREVKTAIFNLLQIDNVEEARSLLNTMKNTERRNIVDNTSDDNVIKKNNDIDKIEKEIKAEKVLLVKYEQDLIDSNILVEKLELQFSQNAEIAKIQDSLNNAVDKKSLIQDHIKMIKENILKTLLFKAPYLIMNKSFNNVKNYLETTISENNSSVPIEVLEQSLSQKVCLCCNNDLSVHKENLAYVEALKQNFTRSEASLFSNLILGMIQNSFDEAPNAENEARELLKQFMLKEQELSKVEEGIKILKKELGVKASKELNLEKTNKSLKAQRNHSEEVKQTIARSIVKIETLEKDKTKAEEELQQILRELNNNKIEEKVITIIESLYNDISSIAKDFSTLMRLKLKEITTNIFKTLIDKKDVNLIKEININERFELEIISYDDMEITQDISQGQRQIVALSFITALAQIAAGESDKIGFPLFMDSPFNRLSGINRDHLIENIPSLTGQWILLLTDTELTMSEERVFKNGGRLGKWYRINQIETYHSEIEEVSIHETMTTRGM